MCRDFGGPTNQLSCDCNVYNSLVDVIDALGEERRAAVCQAPDRVAGAKFFVGGNYQQVYKQEFTCCRFSLHLKSGTSVCHLKISRL